MRMVHLASRERLQIRSITRSQIFLDLLTSIDPRFRHGNYQCVLMQSYGNGRGFARPIVKRKAEIKFIWLDTKTYDGSFPLFPRNLSSDRFPIVANNRNELFFSFPFRSFSFSQMHIWGTAPPPPPLLLLSAIAFSFHTFFHTKKDQSGKKHETPLSEIRWRRRLCVVVIALHDSLWLHFWLRFKYINFSPSARTPDSCHFPSLSPAIFPPHQHTKI